jgi:uncharacterized protein (DUF885 family)
MKHSQRSLRSLAAFLFLSLAVIASAAGVADTADTNKPRSPLDSVVEGYFDRILELNPTVASYIGDYRFNDRLENNLGREWIDAALALEKRALADLRRIDPASLSSAQRLTYDIFRSERERDIASFAFPGELLPLDQFNNRAADFAVWGAGAGAHPFTSTKDYEDFLKRIDGFIVWMDQAIENMRTGMKRGVVQPRVVMLKLLPQLRAIAVDDVQKSVFYEPLRNFPDSVPAADRQRLAAAYEKAIAGKLLPAYRKLADFVEREYIPACRTSVAWSALPDGQAWYAYFVERYTTTNMKPDAIHELGKREVARIEAEMDGVRRDVGYQGDMAAFFEYLKEDPRFFFKNEQEVLDSYRALKARIDKLLPAMFSVFPKADYEIRAVEPFRAQSAAGAFYERPSADGSRPGIFYINTYDMKSIPIYGMETLSLHEAAPGHHFQSAIAQELTDLPRFRRFGGYVAYNEGWALYVESIGKELGLFKDPYQYYGRLNDEMLRAMRLVVDTGLHARGWTREQAIAYMLEHSTMGQNDAVAEVERYIVLPGQALGYKIGQLRITALRAKAQQALGSRFDVREFHTEVLRDGPVPMDVLELKIDRFIAARRQ